MVTIRAKACARRSTTSRRSRTTPARSPSSSASTGSASRSLDPGVPREGPDLRAPLTITVAFVNKDTGEIREQTVFMGDFPMMTEWGTFIINGTERVIVTQLVRSPGAYLMEPKDPTKQVFIANLMPSRGSWLELEIDKKGVVYARIDRKRKLPITTLLPAADDPGYAVTDEAILALFDNSHLHPSTRSRRTPSARGGGADRGLQEAAAGRAADARQRAQPAAPAVLRPQALRPDEGRPLQAEPAARRRHARGLPRPDQRGHPRARPEARRAAASARRAGGLEGLRRRRDLAAARADRRTSSTSTSTSATAACAPSAS